MRLLKLSEHRQRGMRKAADRCRCEALERRRLFAGGQTMQVAIDAKILQVQANFANSIGVTFKFHDCNGTIDFTGDNLAQQSDGKRITVTGTPDSLDSINLNSTTKASSISVHTTGGQFIDLPTYGSSGPMKLIDLSGINLTHLMDIASASKVVLGNGQGVKISVDNSPGLRIKAGNFMDSSGMGSR